MKTLIIIAFCFIGIASFAISPTHKDSVTIDFQEGFDSTEVVILIDGNVEYIKTISTKPELGFASSVTLKKDSLNPIVIQIGNKQSLLPKNPPPFIGVQLSMNQKILIHLKQSKFGYK